MTQGNTYVLSCNITSSLHTVTSGQTIETEDARLWCRKDSVDNQWATMQTCVHSVIFCTGESGSSPGIELDVQ